MTKQENGAASLDTSERTNYLAPTGNWTKTTHWITPYPRLRIQSQFFESNWIESICIPNSFTEDSGLLRRDPVPPSYLFLTVRRKLVLSFSRSESYGRGFCFWKSAKRNNFSPDFLQQVDMLCAFKLIQRSLSYWIWYRVDWQLS